MTQETKEYIDSLSVYQLLYDQRFCPPGDPKFQGEAGIYRMRRLAELRTQDPQAYTSASKAMGW